MKGKERVLIMGLSKGKELKGQFRRIFLSVPTIII